MSDVRAVFDADITFLNGGGLQTQGFRLDVSSADVTEAQIAEQLVRHLGLLMVDRVQLSGVHMVEEAHKGSRGTVGEAPSGGPDGARLIELSHVITAGMTTYPGLPGPDITAHLTRDDSRAHYAPGTEFAIDRISMLGNTGTYLDSPYHRYPNGADLAGLALRTVADLPIVVVRLLDAGRAIDRLPLAALDVTGAAVLLHTGWDQHFGTEAYGQRAPYLTGPAAALLAEAGARLVGIDSVNIDCTDGSDRPAHSTLLAAGIPVLEHVTGLDQVPARGARLHAAPPRVRGFGTFPVRAYALVPSAG